MDRRESIKAIAATLAAAAVGTGIEVHASPQFINQLSEPDRDRVMQGTLVLYLRKRLASLENERRKLLVAADYSIGDDAMLVAVAFYDSERRGVEFRRLAYTGKEACDAKSDAALVKLVDSRAQEWVREVFDYFDKAGEEWTVVKC